MDDRRGADTRLREALLAEECDGREWRSFREQLAAYGYSVVLGWLRSRRMFTECARRGIQLRRPPGVWDEDDLQSLTNDTVANAIEPFRVKALLGGGWDPRGGASLASYFVTGCVFEFGNVYKAWLRGFDERTRLALTTFPVDQLPDMASTSPDPGEIVATRSEVDRVLAAIKDDTTRRAVILREAGYSVNEVADWLGTTPGTVRGALQRVRRGRDRFELEGGEDDHGQRTDR